VQAQGAQGRDARLGGHVPSPAFGRDVRPLGTAISLLTGCALLFFSVSGLWMYLQMWRNRKQRSLKPGWFWQ
jgi:hypothetical protein